MVSILKKTFFVLKIIFFYIVTFILGSFFPKDRRMILLGSNNGNNFIGNAKTLYGQLKKDTDLKVYVILGDKDLVEELNSEGETVIKNGSLEALWLFLRAKTVAVTHGFGDLLGCFPAITQNWIYLGHGIGTKALGYLKEDLALWEKLRLSFLKKCYFISTSDFDRYMWCTMYGLTPQKVPITGYPRNDVLLGEDNFSVRDKPTRILYAPTYREGGATQLFPFPDFAIERLNLLLEVSGMELYIRFHPGQYKESKESIKGFFEYPNIKDLSPDILSDVQGFLPETDILITDFSSISRDFLFLDRPMIFIMNGLEDLGNLALPVREEFAFCGYRVRSYEEFENAIIEISKGQDKFEDIRGFMRDLTYSYIDRESSRRVAELIRELS